MYSVAQYTPTYYTQWNDFVANSKNGTFLFHRDYMEYHSDRFTDFSLLVFEKNKLVAVLPANRVGHVVYSHQGLTYGGLVYGFDTKQRDIIAIYRELLLWLYTAGILKLHLKPVPAIYHKLPAQEQEYVFFLLNAVLERRDGLSVIDYAMKIQPTKSRREAIKRGVKKNLKIVEEPDFKLFWTEILMPNLKKKHDVKPVHTVEEIEYLYSRFPDNIKHYNVYFEGKIVAGTTMYLTDTVAHPQYISGQEDKNALGSLDYLYNYLIETYSGKNYFDFGPSTESNGRKLNEGLIFWKESFGARTIIQDFYSVATASYKLLDNVLI